MRKRVIKIYCCVIAVAVIAAAAWGISAKGTHTDWSGEENYLDSFDVAEMLETTCVRACESMRENLDDSPVIAQVTFTGDVEHLFHVSRQPVTVSKVFKGEALSEGDEIYLTSSSWRLLVNSSFRAIERGYVNIMKPGAEYLVFITEQVGESNDVPVYSLNSVSIVAPVFCYEDSQNVILPVPSGNTYVPYKEVQGNEFFVTSQESLDMILALKDEFIQKYPMSEQP